jgi:type IV pilus assembly protein PilC
MPIFIYKAAHQNGKTFKGRLWADTFEELRDELEEKGLFLIYAKSEKKAAVFFFPPRSRQLISFCLHMSFLSKAHIPVRKSIETFCETLGPCSFYNVLTEICEKVKGGLLLSQAFQHYPRFFDSVFIALVQVGEATGNFSSIFAHLSLHLEWTAATKKRLAHAIRYPLFLIILALNVMIFMLIFVLPQFTQFLKAMGQDLPFHTRLLINLSQFAKAYWFILLLSSCFLGITIYMSQRMIFSIRVFIDRICYMVPVLGHILQKSALTEFSHSTVLLLQEKMPLLQTLHICKSLSQNAYFQSVMAKVIQRIQEGNTLSQALQKSSFFPRSFVELVHAGEQAGVLEQVLVKSKEFYEQDLKDSIDILLQSLGPFLMLTLGAFLLWIVMATFYPMYQSLSSITS